MTVVVLSCVAYIFARPVLIQIVIITGHVVYQYNDIVGAKSLCASILWATRLTNTQYHKLDNASK